MEGSNLTLYHDGMSQPSRAVLAFLLFNKIPHKISETLIREGATRKPEFAEINPFAKVPTIDDNGFKLFESHAILRYLARTRKVPDHWYPSDPKKVAYIDAYLDWHHTGTRKAAPFVVLTLKWEFPGVFSWKSLNAEQVTKDFDTSFIALETIWLKDEKFIGGAEEISIADLSAFCELEQLSLIGYDFSSYPKINSWLKKVREIEEIKAAHERFFKVKAFMLANKAKQDEKNKTEQTEKTEKTETA